MAQIYNKIANKEATESNIDNGWIKQIKNLIYIANISNPHLSETNSICGTVTFILPEFLINIYGKFLLRYRHMTYSIVHIGFELNCSRLINYESLYRHICS